MDIHAPNGPISSWREVFTHLGIVTVGILIALSLEGCVEWKHHRDLAKEAHENLTAEIRDNRTELENSIRQLPGTEKQVRAIIDHIDAVDTEKKKSDSIELRYSFDDAHLANASWTTAQTTGALSFMKYDDVKKFSAVYDLQREYVDLQRDLISRIIDSNDFGKGKNGLDTAREHVSAVDRSMQGLEQVGKALDDEYKKF